MGDLPVGHVQGVKITLGDEVSEEGLGLTTCRPVADDNPGTASVDTEEMI